MLKIVFAAFLLTSTASVLFSQQDITLKKGSQLIYAYEDGKKTVDITVTVLDTDPLSYKISYKDKGAKVTATYMSKLPVIGINPELYNQTSNQLLYPTLTVFSSFADTIRRLSDMHWDMVNRGDSNWASLDTIAVPVLVSGKTAFFGVGGVELSEFIINGKEVTGIESWSVSETRDSTGNEMEFGEGYIMRYLVDDDFPVITYFHWEENRYIILIEMKGVDLGEE